ncbi:ADP-ribose pyrophosphatase, mitochondrial [Trichinella pseudospiralis]|uniref:ADP-ribose pyrophosphatase, mitochondrial n=2 Tax=Trichinella pseudospiralis TaxID=6337 RepID=A0A0V1FRT4_TRIPS|nr:ADP-ribose pyrophosphatase, mitochondrial [Trichinella pseudospiralis]
MKRSKSVSCILLAKGSKSKIEELHAVVCDSQLKASLSKKYSLCEISKYPYGDKYSLYVPSSVSSWKKALFLYKPVDFDLSSVNKTFQNPRGRTGVRGLGGLPHYGENRKATNFITYTIQDELLNASVDKASHLFDFTSSLTKDKLVESVDKEPESETCDRESLKLVDLVERAGNLDFNSMKAQKGEKLSGTEEDFLVKQLKRPLNDLIQAQQPGKPYYTVKRVLAAELCDSYTLAFNIKIRETKCSVSQVFSQYSSGDDDCTMKRSKSVSCILLAKGSKRKIDELHAVVCDSQLKAPTSKKYSLCEISKYPYGDIYSLYVPSSVSSWKKALFLYKPVDFDLSSVNKTFQNPRGRTGVRGLGGLPHYGENRKVIPVVLRKHKGEIEMLTIMKSSGSWQFPQFFEDGDFKGKPLGKQFEDELKTYFQSVGFSKEEIRQKLAAIYADVETVPVKLPTDPLDTDQAWLKTHIAVIFDKQEKHFGSVAFDPSANELSLGWKKTDKEMLKALKKLPTKSSDVTDLGSQNRYYIVYRVVPVMCVPAGALFLYSWYIALPIIFILLIIYGILRLHLYIQDRKEKRKTALS